MGVAALVVLAQAVPVGALAALLVLAVTRAVRRAADRRTAEDAWFALQLGRLGVYPMLGGTFVGGWRGRPFRLISRQRGDARLGLPSIVSVGTPVPTGRLEVGARGRRIGDEVFDRTFRVSGPSTDLAVLTADVRAALLASTARGRARIEDGMVWMDLLIPAGPVTRLDPILDPLLTLAERIGRVARRPLAELLVEWATDPAPGIRRTCLDLVAHRHPPSFVRVLLDDPDPLVRVRAATALGETGPVFAVAVDPTVPSRVRLYAVALLVRRGTDEERLAAAVSLASGSDPAARASVSLCEAVGPRAEPVVLELLDLRQPRAVRGAVRWAAHHGSLATLGRLRSIEHHTSRLSPLAAEVRIAIDLVRSRGSTLVGGVALCAEPPEVGTLSLPVEP